MLHIITDILAVEKILELADKDGYITVVLPVPIDFLLANTFYDFLDYISKNIVGNLALLDIRYEMEGSLNQSVLFKIRGNVSMLLEYLYNS